MHQHESPAITTTKRIRSTSSGCSDPKHEVNLSSPFRHLKELDIYLNSPTHLPVFQYILSFSTCITHLTFEQFFEDYAESLVMTTLFQWNPLKLLTELKITKGAKLSINALNHVIQKCPELRKLGQVSTWGKIKKHQLETIRKEIKLRNFDLVIDTE